MKSRNPHFILTATSALLLAPAAFAADGTWTNASGGSWNTNTNWSGGPPGITADGSGSTAFFNAQNITANTTVTLDGARTIGNLTFGDTDTATAFSWNLNTGTAGPLTLAGATPTISVALGASQNLTINAVLAGTSGFTKSGTSTLLLANAGNTISGAVVISLGNIQLNAAALKNTSSLAINGGNLVLATTAATPIGGTISFGGGHLQYNNNPGTDLSAQFSTAANQAYRINTSSSGIAVTYASNLSSSGGTLTKLGGGGKLTLAAANTFDGATTLTGGNLALSHAQALQNSPIATSATGTANGSTTLGYILSGVTAPVFGGLTGTRALKSIFDTDAEGGVGTGGYDGVTNLTLNPGTGASYSYDATIVNGAAGMTLTKTGAGTQALTVANSYTGGTAINGGILAIGHAAALGTTGTISFGGGTLQYNGITTDLSSRFSTAASQAYSVNTNGQTVTWAGALTSSGGTIAKSGAGTLTLTGGLANTSGGAINVNGGTLLFQGGSAMSGTITVASGAVFSFNQAFVPANILPNALVLSGPGAGTSGALHLYGNATASGPITLDADTTISHSFNNATISGSITGTDRNLALKTTESGQFPLLVSAPITLGTGGITVQSAGGTNSVILSGSNSYSGGTLVSTGTLLVNNSTGSGTGSAAVTANVGTTLGGTGRINGAVNVSGVLSPGASIESLGTGTLTLNTGSNFKYEMNTGTVGGDLLYVTGDLNIGSNITLDLTDLAVVSQELTAGTKFTLLSYTGLWNNGAFNGYADDSTFLFATNQWLINYNDLTGGSNFTSDQTGATGFVTLAVVPEPSSLGLLGLGGMGALLVRRRRGN